MDLITHSPGLHHLAETIFINLNCEDLLNCQKVNENWRRILLNPWFWYNKSKHDSLLAPGFQLAWTKFIQRLSDSNLPELRPFMNQIYTEFLLEHTKISNRLQSGPVSKKQVFEPTAGPNGPVLVTSYICSANPDDKSEDTRVYNGIEEHSEIIKKVLLQHGSAEIVQILDPLPNIPNAGDRHGWTPIQKAAKCGHTDIVRILAPLTEKPNATAPDGWTPLQDAAWNGHAEIVKILATLTDNPNAPGPDGWTPLQEAARNGHVDIVRILAPFSDNPNAPYPDRDGLTPIQYEARKRNGNVEMVKFMATFTNNPNAPDQNGWTPIQEAAVHGNANIIRVLSSLVKNPNEPGPDGQTPAQNAKAHLAAYSTKRAEIISILNDSSVTQNAGGQKKMKIAAAGSLSLA